MTYSKIVSVVFISLLQLCNLSEQAVTTDGCGTTKGCLREPADCSDTDCTFFATYSYQQDYVVFELFGKDSAWVAIGFNALQQRMVISDALVCYVNNSVVLLKSAKLEAQDTPALKEAKDLNLTYSSTNGDAIQCRFTHPFRPTNTSILRNLDDEFYLVWATSGEFRANVIQKHRTRGVSAYRVNLTRNIEVRAPSAGISADDCGKTIGCLRYPAGCEDGDCDYMATYSYQNDRVTFEMFGKESQWVAIGFSDDNLMPNTDAVVCKTDGSPDNISIVIRSANIIGRSRPTLEKAGDLHLSGRSYFDNHIQCRFSHPYIPEDGSNLRNLSRKAFMIYAKGLLVLSGNNKGKINQHVPQQSSRGASPELVDFKKVTNVGENTGKRGISTDGCGDTMGCLRFSSDCNGGSCEFVATYTYQPTTNIVTFELFGKSANWVAIGFSENKKMPDTGAVICYNLNGNVVIRSAKLVAYSLPGLEEENDLNLLDTSLDGGIRCRFTYPLTPGSTSTLRRLDQELFLLYAKGSVSGSTPSQHSGGLSARGSSGEPVNVTSNVESTATSPSKLQKKVHGSLMAVVWILLASSGLFFARYTRDNWPDTKLLGTKVWFQFHRFLMICVVLGTIASIVVIFVDLEGYTEREETIVKVHAIFGLIVLVLAVLQPIGALLRPHPGTPKRPIFNIFHRSFGASAFGLAMITIILGLDFFNKDEAYYTVIVYIIFLGAAFVIMDISKYLHDRRNSASENATIPGGMEIQSNTATKSSFHLTLSQILLGIVSIGSLIVTIVVIVYINHDDEEE